MTGKQRNTLWMVAGLSCASLTLAAVPAGYPTGYQATIDAASKEGKLVIYATTDLKLVQPLVNDFQALYPAVKIEYNDVNSTELYNRFISEVAANAGSADVLWSSAMDMQVKLANDGYAQAYDSPEMKNLPDWANWRKEVYGTTFEPITIVYNKRLVAANEVPQTHADFINLLKTNPTKYQGKVTTYDVEKSGAGFLFLSQDAKQNPGVWDLAKTLGERGVRLQSSTGTMLERISTGENLIGYNILGSYALARAQKDPQIGVVMPKDYTLVISRLAMIPKSAKHPNAARLWMDYLLSKRGQTLLSEKAELPSVRKDIEDEHGSAHLRAQLGSAIKPVAVGPGLLTYLDQAKRLAFLKQWREATVRK
ncbi:MAG: hypothetical protein RI925_692 [Pseudomonadota bacterium]|jgi:iron(III) transport system substrate-binding protein